MPLAPIDPKAAREIFIHFALVEGEHYTHAPFSKHNQKLIEEVRALEAKARKRDVLVDDQVRYAFYCNGPVTGYQVQSQLPMTGIQSPPTVTNVQGQTLPDSFSFFRSLAAAVRG